MGKHKIVHAYRGQDHHGLRKEGGGSEGHHQLGESALTCFKGGPNVDAQRVQTVETKRESKSFCVHKSIKLSLVINDNLC